MPTEEMDLIMEPDRPDSSDNNDDTSDIDSESDASEDVDSAMVNSDISEPEDFGHDNSSLESAEEEEDEPQEDEDCELNPVVPLELPDELSELAEGREHDLDDDSVVQAILRARQRHSKHPSDILCEDDCIVDLTFHPGQNIIASATYTGDAHLYKYLDESTELINTLELHLKAIRDIEFSEDGQALLSCSKDKSIMISNVETGKLVKVYEGAHEDGLACLYILDEHLFVSGCDSGYVKLWDVRKEEPVFSLRVMEDTVNAIISTEQKRHIAVASGGSITSINMHARKIQVQSEEYEHDFTCLGLFKQESKLLAGSSKGTMYLFNWGEFGYHSDEFTGMKHHVNCMLPISESVVVAGYEDGNLRATHLFPTKHLGVVGQHDCSVESLDISHDGTIIASASVEGNNIKFWNIKYFEDVEVAKKKSNKNKDMQHNLPSSSKRNAGEFFSDLAGAD